MSRREPRLHPTFAVLLEVDNERGRQDAKWGEQNHPNGTGPMTVLAGLPVHSDALAGAAYGIYADEFERWARDRVEVPDDVVTYAAILLEEVAEAMATLDPAQLRTELLQVAAVAVAWVEKIDRESARADRLAAVDASEPCSRANGVHCRRHNVEHWRAR